MQLKNLYLHNCTHGHRKSTLYRQAEVLYINLLPNVSSHRLLPAKILSLGKQSVKLSKYNR